ncbi:MAG TPA: TlpA disulfide reductase family protein [Candidatus Limnocylindrales bacterium]
MVLIAVADQLRAPGPDGSAAARAVKGAPAPAVVGRTLDGMPFDLASYRGRPVILNFWGPSCLPCREEFPLFKQELAAHAGDRLAIVGILMFDSPEPARTFIADYGATWPTVEDPDGAIRTAYRAVARPQSYFIDRDGILRAIQVGQVTSDDFDRLYPSIAGAGPTPSAP